MRINEYRLIVSLVLVFLTASALNAQFYNGLQMQFGKNRIQYGQSDILESDFYYSFYRFDQFDVYFNPNGQELAKYVGEKAFQEIALLENYFEHSLSKRIIFLSFNKLTDFRQSNIGLITGQEDTNIGGSTKILDNKVFLYFDGNHKNLDSQIKAAVAQVILDEMLYSGNVRERVTTSTLLNLPEWFYQGLVAYVSKDWDVEIENRVKDGIVSGSFEKFNRLMGEEAIYAGHSIWHFIAETFGESVIPNIIYFTKINRSGSAGILNVLGVSLSSLTYEWLYFYKSRFEQDENISADSAKTDFQLKARKQLEYVRAKVSPDGRYIAYSTLQKGQVKVFLYDYQTGKSKRIYKQGAKLQQIQDRSIPVFNWHPSGQILGLITEFKGINRYSILPLSSRKWEHSELKNYEKILDFDYASDGLSLVLSGVKNGQSDIFVHNLVAHTDFQISNDLADDFSPKFAKDDNEIIFSSNRLSGDLVESQDVKEFSPSFDLYVYDYKNRSTTLTSIAPSRYLNRIKPLPATEMEYAFLGDDNGILNRYAARYDSTISFIDTLTHYRYFTEIRPLTNLDRSILDHSYSKDNENYTDLRLAGNKYYLGNSDDGGRLSQELISTDFRKSLTRKLSARDSISKARLDYYEALAARQNQIIEMGPKDSARLANQYININQYRFDQEVNGSAASQKFGFGRSDGKRDPVTGRKYELPSLRIYQPSFYINYLASQVDFSFLNASYQPFTGGAVYYNPGFNMLFKIGTQDLFEDYKITGGVRFGGDFDSNEYLLSVQNLKHRWDHELIFHRQGYTQPTIDYFSLVKTSSQALYYVAKYPISQVASLRGTASIRSDNNVFLSTDLFNLVQQDIHKYWAGAKLEFVYDNTFQYGLNLYEGTRYKVFGEYFQQVNGNYSDVFIVGADFRHYQPIHRTLIWANRFATSTSFGSGRLIYYMGAVDNWTNLSRTVETFDYSVPIDTTQNFVFQTLATNMRGFSQNIRNGNSFAVFNSELRWPVVRYFANRPLNSDFLNNFQLVGFFDLGTAWSGPHPWDERNHLNREIIENGPLTIVIDKGNEPLVAGFGFGVRSRLLGYFVRLDWAWGIENSVLLPRLFHLSLSLDF